MKKVPYYGNPNNDWCALACYTMAAQYLLPDEGITFEQFKDLGEAKKGYVVWAFPIWKWMMDRGVHITNYDISDMDAWVKNGIGGLQNSLTPKEFEFYQKNTYDLEKVTGQAIVVHKHPNFVAKQAKVTWDMIVDEVNKPGICDLTLNGYTLHRVEGFSVHRVVLIDITNDEVIFHDPTAASDGAYKHESIEFFKTAIDGLSGPELTRYYL